jgi:hypothetical protein
MIEVNLKIYESDGYICASGVGVGIYTYAKSWNKLIKNIHDAVDLYFNIPSGAGARIILDIEPQPIRDVEPSSG